MALLTGERRTRCDQRGSGTAIGVAIIFPMLVLVIVALRMLTDSVRMEQGIHAAANQAGRTAALCCRDTGGASGAETVARAALGAAARTGARNRILCDNDFAGDATVIFTDVAGNDVTTRPDIHGDYEPVPPGGTVQVIVFCRFAPELLGGVGSPEVGAVRSAVGNGVDRPLPVPASHMTAPAGLPAGLPGRARSRTGDQRGDYAIFIAVIASALLLFSGIAYDAPRLNAARQEALHKANEAARVAAATIASGGTVADARRAAADRMAHDPLIYGEEVHVTSLDCVGSRVQVTVMTGYTFRSAIGAAPAPADDRGGGGGRGLPGAARRPGEHSSLLGRMPAVSLSGDWPSALRSLQLTLIVRSF